SRPESETRKYQILAEVRKLAAAGPEVIFWREEFPPAARGLFLPVLRVSLQSWRSARGAKPIRRIDPPRERAPLEERAAAAAAQMWWLLPELAQDPSRPAALPL